MLIFAEKVVLGGTMPVLILLAVNPMGFDWKQRITGAVAIIFLALFVAFTLQKQTSRKQELKEKPQCEPEIKSCVMARLWSPIVKTPSVGETLNAQFAYQELFCQWVLTLAPKTDIPARSITVSYLTLDDLVTVVPPDAVVGAPQKGWILGFEEKKRKPSYYSRVFTFTNISNSRPLNIRIRRPITEFVKKGYQLSEPNIIRVLDMSSSSCVLNAPQSNPTNEAEKLNRQAAALVHWKLRGPNSPPLPLRSDAGILPGPGETQASVELYPEKDM